MKQSVVTAHNFVYIYVQIQFIPLGQDGTGQTEAIAVACIFMHVYEVSALQFAFDQIAAEKNSDRPLHAINARALT